MHSEFDFLHSFFIIQNGFPSNLIFKQIRIIFDNHCKYNNDNDISSNTDDVAKYFFSFLYFGQQSKKFKSELNSICPKATQKIVQKATLGLGRACLYITM